MAGKTTQRKAGPAPIVDNGTRLDRALRICTSIPSVTEKLSHGEPTFFTP
ncbi:MAG TPA: hypothetical protein PLZ95_11065 [Bryobacteraceae bacterium]|nr:hypothetical protein [Bryobacteraceae bacterium]